MPGRPGLETWGAVEFKGMAPQGSRKPVFIQAWRQIGRVGNRTRFANRTFLVKSLDSPEIMCREVLGNMIARAFGLTTPRPAIVFVPEPVAEDANRQMKDRGTWLDLRAGEAAGCEKVTLPANVHLLESGELPHVKQALQLFVFDMLAQSADRVVTNPNCAIAETGYVVYDFEQCFTLDGRLMEPGDPWCPCARGLANNHMFYPGLRGVKWTEGELLAGLKRLTPEALNRFASALPPDWRPEAQRVLAHVECVRKHADEFEKDIAEALK